jgi:hypothetical protein
MLNVASVPRNHAEAVLDLHYAIRYCGDNERFYRRAATALSFLLIFGGSSAFAGMLGGRPELVGWVGLALAAVATIEHLVSPIERATRFEMQARRYQGLNAVASSLTLGDLDARFEAIRADSPIGLRVLEPIAYNANLLSEGFPENVMPTTRWERIVALLA